MTSENACTTNEMLEDGPEQPISLLSLPPREDEKETDERLLAEDETEDESDEVRELKMILA